MRTRTLSIGKEVMRSKILGRLLHFYFLFYRPLTLGARCVILNTENEILLVKHSYTPGWHLPGGGVEKGETIVAALIREVREEAGIELFETPRLHGIYFNVKVSKRDHVAIYVAGTFKKAANHSGSKEISKISFFDLNDLPEDIDPGTASRIAEVTGKQAVSDTW